MEHFLKIFMTKPDGGNNTKFFPKISPHLPHMYTRFSPILTEFWPDLDQIWRLFRTVGCSSPPPGTKAGRLNGLRFYPPTPSEAKPVMSKGNRGEIELGPLPSPQTSYPTLVGLIGVSDQLRCGPTVRMLLLATLAPWKRTHVLPVVHVVLVVRVVLVGLIVLVVHPSNLKPSVP